MYGRWGEWIEWRKMKQHAKVAAFGKFMTRIKENLLRWRFHSFQYQSLIISSGIWIFYLLGAFDLLFYFTLAFKGTCACKTLFNTTQITFIANAFFVILVKKYVFPFLLDFLSAFFYVAHFSSKNFLKDFLIVCGTLSYYVHFSYFRLISYSTDFDIV